MASTYSNLKFQLMATGENNTTWGNVTNVNLGTAIEEAITGSADVAFSSGNVTLTLTDVNTTQSARNLRLNLTGTTGGARDLIVPAIEKVYIVNNGCADAVTVKNSSGTGIAVPAGKTMYVFNNGTNVVDAITHLTSLTLGTPLPVASGGTGSNTGSGASLTSLNGSNVSSGVVAVSYGGTGATTLTGLVKGAGTSAFTAATAGTDYVAPATATNFTAQQTFTGSSTTIAAKLISAAEKVTVSATAATGTISVDLTTQSVLYFTTNASANWVVNLRASSGTSLNTALATGESITFAFLVTQGSTAYYNTSVQVDGTTSGVTTKWQGVAPTAGTVSSINVYTYTVIKTGSAAFTVLAAKTAFV
jgi:hypothetical protein